MSALDTSKAFAPPPSRRCAGSGRTVPLWPGWHPVGLDHKVQCPTCGRRIAITSRGVMRTHLRPAEVPE